MYIQQGDVLLHREDSYPSTVEILKTDLLHKGQNHHHRVRGDFKIAKNDSNTLLLSSGCELFHEEHKTLAIPEGVYRLGIVQEYDHWLEEARAVVD